MTDLEEKLTQENNDLRRQLGKFYLIDISNKGLTPYFGLTLHFHKEVLENDSAVKDILREIVKKMYDIR